MTDIWRSDVDEAMAAARAVAGGGDPRAFTAAIPAIVHTQNAAAAHALVTRFGDMPDLLPEHLMLLGVVGLTPRQQHSMLAALIPAAAAWPEDMALQAAQICTRMGAYGFSFPLWRFLAQRAADMPALLEQYGFSRLVRASDVRNAALLRHDPAHDLFGVGFWREDAAWIVEYRRAYLLCACRMPDDAAVVVIRNNSYFFGRDRLPAPVYAAFGAVSSAALQGLGADSFKSGLLTPWPQALAVRDALGACEKLRRTARLLQRLDSEEQAISGWLCGVGRGAAAAFAAGCAPFYAGLISAQAPPWFPHQVAPVTPEHLATLQVQGAAGTKLAFLSGIHGDFPATPTGHTAANVCAAR